MTLWSRWECLLLVGIGWNLHQVQVSALEAKAELLELTQFDRAHNLIEAQKALHQIERQQLLDSIAVLGSSGDSVQVASMRGMLSNIDSSYAWWNGLSSYLRPGAVMPLDTALLLSNAWIVGHANLGTPPDSIG